MGYMPGCRKSARACNRRFKCDRCEARFAKAQQAAMNGGGTFNSTSFSDKPQRNDSSVTNTYFNAGKVDGDNHGHVKHRDNPDGTTDYLYARDVEGNEYDV